MANRIPDLERVAERIREEGAIPLTVAARHVPTTIGTRGHISRESLLRWITRGVHGIRLEAVLMGSRWWTSRQAVDRFLAARSSRRILQETGPNWKARRREAEEASRQLAEELGD